MSIYLPEQFLSPLLGLAQAVCLLYKVGNI